MAAPGTPARGGAQRIPRPAGWLPGPDASWLAAAAVPKLSLAGIRRRLADLPAPQMASEMAVDFPVQRRESAVLVALFEEAGEARVILTKRPETMPSHRGEVAFPGGKLEPGVDADLEATALREAFEEVGLDPAAVEIVAELDALGTVVSRFLIAPFVGFLAERPELIVNPREVVRVFDVALSELIAPGVHHAERWATPLAEIEVHFFELADETVWGATARILYGFLSYLLGDGRAGTTSEIT